MHFIRFSLPLTMVWAMEAVDGSKHTVLEKDRFETAWYCLFVLQNAFHYAEQ